LPISSGENKVELTERRAGNTIVLAPAGRIDMSTAEQFRERLIPLIASTEAGAAVVLDFSGVDYISSAGLRVLMLAAKEARSSGSLIAVAALQPLVNEIFQISRFDKVLPCHAGVNEALAAVQPAA
jgi:anti-sigma B factor antagonist